MKHLLILLSFLLLFSPLFGQSGKPQTIIIPTGSLGDISEIRKKMLGKTLESKLDDYFAIVPKELFEEAQEQTFQEMDSDECTEDQCIRMIQELLQVENSFKMDLMYEDGDTQISITWNDQDQKRVEEDYCEGCKTKELRLMIDGLIDRLVGDVGVAKQKVVPKVSDKVVSTKLVQENIGVMFGDKVGDDWIWFKDGNDSRDIKYVGEIQNEQPNGKGILRFPDGKKIEGIFKDGKPWDVLANQTAIPIGLYSLGKVSQENIGVIYGEIVGDDWIWFKNSNDSRDIKYCGEILNERPNGNGFLRFPDGKKIEGIFRDGKPWDVSETQNWRC
jgi:hypothetical protein